MLRRNQKGQTLIETLVAIFVLTTGLISAVTLAIYSFTSTDNASKQIVATALAREGVEAVKNIRDSNWLQESKASGLSDCSATMGAGQLCYTSWLNGLGNGGTLAGQVLDFDINNNKWNLHGAGTSGYSLNLYNGEYVTNGTGSPSVYSRKIDITPLSATEIQVISSVWWTGRRCPAVTNPSSLPQSCKVILEMRLTNWKNY